MNEPTKTKGRQPTPLPAIDLPQSVTETVKFLSSVVETEELYDKVSQRMVNLTPAMLKTALKLGFSHLEQILLRDERQKDVFLTKRFGTVFRTLDFEPPVEGQIIIAEFNGERHQGIVKTGQVIKWAFGQEGDKICALNQVSKWRPCVFTDQPVNASTVKGDVLGALERGARVRQGEKL